MSQFQSFHQFLLNLRNGDEDAARLLVHRYTHTLVRVAHRALSPRLRAKLDPEDIVQSVYRSFCTRLVDGQIVLTDWDHLWRLLRRCTLSKCCAKADHYHAQRRDVRREHSLSDLVDPETPACEPACWGDDALTAQLIEETLQQILKGLDGREKDIVLLKINGFTPAQISKAVGCNTAKVYRLLSLARALLEDMALEGSGAG